MATLLNNIPTNLTEYPNSFKRQGAFPLEAYSVFTSYEKASEYARTSKIAYVGQLLVVTETDQQGGLNCSLYMIKDEIGTLETITTLTSLNANINDLSARVDNKSDEFDIIEIDGGNAQNAIDGNW